jgi:hypothetical protein
VAFAALPSFIVDDDILLCSCDLGSRLCLYRDLAWSDLDHYASVRLENSGVQDPYPVSYNELTCLVGRYGVVS